MVVLVLADLTALPPSSLLMMCCFVVFILLQFGRAAGRAVGGQIDR